MMLLSVFQLSACGKGLVREFVLSDPVVLMFSVTV
jgi:hypothetical protein